jgi:hypothetical protein
MCDITNPSNLSDPGVIKYCSLKHIDDPSPGAVQNCIHEVHAMQDTRPPGAKRQGSYYDTADNDLTGCLTPLYRQEGSADKWASATDSAMLFKPTVPVDSRLPGQQFWEPDQPAAPISNFCAGVAHGDSKTYAKCMSTDFSQPAKGAGKAYLDLWSPVYSLQTFNQEGPLETVVILGAIVLLLYYMTK